MAGKIEALEQSKLLQSDWRLAPRPGLAQGVAVIVAPERWLAARLPDRQIIGGEQTAMPAPGHVEHRVVSAETIDRLGYEAAIPGAAGGLDLRLAIGARALGLPEYPLVGVGQSRITEQSARGRYVAARQIHRSRGRPLGVEQVPDACDRGADRRHQRVAMAREGDCRLEHGAQPQRPMIAQHPQPGIEGAGHHGGEQSGPWHQVEPELPIGRDRGCLRRHTLAADHLDRVLAGAVQDDRQIAARTIQVRFDHLERESRGRCGVESVAAALEDGHAGCRGQPVRRRHHPERAEDLRAGREIGHHRAAPPAAARGSGRPARGSGQVREPLWRSRSMPS